MIVRGKGAQGLDRGVQRRRFNGDICNSKNNKNKVKKKTTTQIKQIPIRKTLTLEKCPAVAVKRHPHYLKNGGVSFFLFATNHILVIS